jgi:cytochrome b pre-mRNA-processing protein 3|tara:strand:+ start:613 stop:1083 length:471 start_codon:yes stop_codon:yes gene_type:complete
MHNSPPLLHFSSSERSVLQRAADRLYASVTARAEDAILLQIFDAERSFRWEHSLLVLHVWLILCRLRGEGEGGRELGQMMYDSFQDDVELRVRSEGLNIGAPKWLQALEQNFYGSAVRITRKTEPEELLYSIILSVFLPQYQCLKNRIGALLFDGV